VQCPISYVPARLRGRTSSGDKVYGHCPTGAVYPASCTELIETGCREGCWNPISVFERMRWWSLVHTVATRISQSQHSVNPSYEILHRPYDYGTRSSTDLQRTMGFLISQRLPVGTLLGVFFHLGGLRDSSALLNLVLGGPSIGNIPSTWLDLFGNPKTSYRTVSRQL